MTDPSLAHEAVWDDTHLVDSWNEAFEEYMNYHSIAAKSGKITTPPTEMEAEKLTNGIKERTTAETRERVQYEASESERYEPSVGVASKNSQATDSGSTNAGGAVPQLLMASVQDDGMKKLMMSWYYAGYYTGLHEGKQQGFASALGRQQGG